MVTTPFKVLNGFITRYNHNPALQQIGQQLESAMTVPVDSARRIELMNSAIPLIEEEIWQAEPDDSTINSYQLLYRELEQLIAERGNDTRPKFIITIPVADRPQHLECCLASLLTLCQRFNYGGQSNGQFHKVLAIIADDSREPENIASNRAIADHFSARGLKTHYFGQQQQLQQLEQLGPAQLSELRPVLGTIDSAHFYHKGASIMRNIAYLYLHQLQQASDEPMLFYFIDSDQEFQVKVRTQSGEQDLYAISYLHKLAQIFARSDISILTGKVVGDPPVSPSVMAGNFLEDVLAFLHQMSSHPAESPCQFHDPANERVDDAAYHDMADLFGFKATLESYRYHCTLHGNHDHRACFSDFADKLNRFFDGEHPTRKSYYEHQDLSASISAARTIYSGNYILRPAALDYFIPFATLKLRMAGPVLGRIIKAEQGEKFVSANLPMLHKRTVHETGRSEFRPGIDRDADLIDLSGEFERQYFGDVMLFTMEQLTAAGYPNKRLPEALVREQVHATEAALHDKYQHKQQQIIHKISLLKQLFSDPANWWNSQPDVEPALVYFEQFIANIDHNFGNNARAYELIAATANRKQRLEDIVTAIMHYSDDRANWHAAMQAGKH